MFVDEARIKVTAGRGGDGIASFLREKYKPKGGPAGGDGGKGGDIIFEVTRETRTLFDLYRQKVITALPGDAGQKNKKSGKGAPDKIIRVPPGSIVKDAKTNEIMFDLTEDGARIVIAKGGKGGLGNQHFATPRNQAPRKFTEGRLGESYDLIVELKLIADAGLLGLPNAGKSTFLSRVSAARPKVADYPFTTKEPMLGIVTDGKYRELVIADLPGLIEGAHEGAGLGHEFLKHVERTRILIHMVDAAPLDGQDPVERVKVIRAELQGYSEELASRPEVLVANKTDLPEAAENVARLREEFGRVYEISAATGAGLKPLLGKIFELANPPRK